MEDIVKRDIFRDIKMLDNRMKYRIHMMFIISNRYIGTVDDIYRQSYIELRNLCINKYTRYGLDTYIDIDDIVEEFSKEEEYIIKKVFVLGSGRLVDIVSGI